MLLSKMIKAIQRGLDFQQSGLDRSMENLILWQEVQFEITNPEVIEIEGE